jgi:Abscisic acid G-protein coupled receptor/The Golgi pH Regulator (GPHR) Family N-terminal
MLPTDLCEDDACRLALYEATGPQRFSGIILSLLPFIFTFLIVSIGVQQKLFPLLSGQHSKSDDHPDASPGTRQIHTIYGSKSLRHRIAAISFSTTIALAAVLAELILCEISNTVNPAARTVAWKFTVRTLLFLLIILIPFLELQSIVRGAGWEFRLSEKGKIPKVPWMLQLFGFAGWLTCFWWLGEGLPGTYIEKEMTIHNAESISDACLERIGVIGISLMALLSGFASVSAPWQCFGARPRPVTESDLARKQAGLDATNEMLAAKRSRLRALQHKMSDAPQEGFMTKVIGSIRGNADMQELKSLNLEIAGLETMALSLSTSLTMLHTRYATSKRATTPIGKFMVLPTYIFSVYCIYRILATTLTTLRRFLFSPSSTFSSSDPISRILGLLAKHWDPALDQAAWSRQISFLFSGIILFASFNSVLQTFHLFTRYTPGLLYQAQANAALIVGQISATYVISSALLLRSNLPSDVGSVIEEALGSGVLDALFVERWFEGWFLIGGVGTALGIWLGRKLGDSGEEWDDFAGDIESGQKRS